MIQIDYNLEPGDLADAVGNLWELSARKIADIEASWEDSRGSPVFTADGRYTTRGWTDWTQGFRVGSALLQFDAAGDSCFLDLARRNLRRLMPPHLTHAGVHDHGFNNVSTYGNLRRLIREGKAEDSDNELALCELALKVSGAVQAMRWTSRGDETGYIYSFNGPHSLFADTIRSLRSLALAHMAGHVLMDEHDERVSLLDRLIQHAKSTAGFNIYYGQGRDIYDIPGRVAHESVFNVKDGRYRCPSSQQGYSAFTTWTRGLAWVMLGFAEQVEFLRALDSPDVTDETMDLFARAARVTCDFYISETPADGVPYWDTGAPNLGRLGDYQNTPAQPYNEWEPVDSSAAAIAAQGLLRLGRYMGDAGQAEASRRYWHAGLTVLRTLLNEPYLSSRNEHQGLLLHSIYHRPNGWDYVPAGARIPCGESSMWGDYHLREAGLYTQRIIRGEPYYTFYGPVARERDHAR